MSTITRSGTCSRTTRASADASPTWPTTSNPAPVSRLTIPSRRRTSSSATTTRLADISRRSLCRCRNASRHEPRHHPQEEAEADRAQLVEEQAALRRVATLVASGVEPGPLFDAVAAEVEALFRTDISAVVRFEGDGTVTVMGAHGGPHRPGARVDLDPGYVVAAVYRTQQAARFDVEDCRARATGHRAGLGRALGTRSSDRGRGPALGGDHDRVVRPRARARGRPSSRRLQRAGRYRNREHASSRAADGARRGAGGAAASCDARRRGRRRPGDVRRGVPGDVPAAGRDLGHPLAPHGRRVRDGGGLEPERLAPADRHAPSARARHRGRRDRPHARAGARRQLGGQVERAGEPPARARRAVVARRADRRRGAALGRARRRNRPRGAATRRNRVPARARHRAGCDGDLERRDAFRADRLSRAHRHGGR